MVGNGVHTVPDGHRWANEVDGRRVAEPFERKVDAIAAGRLLAIRAGLEHHIHNQDGTLSAKNSYGSDPRNVRG